MRMVTGSRRRTDTSSCRLSAAASRPDADLTLISLLVRCVDSAPMSSREAELSWTLSALSCMPFATAASAIVSSLLVLMKEEVQLLVVLLMDLMQMRVR